MPRAERASRKQLERQVTALRIIVEESYLDMADLMDRARRENVTDDMERVKWVNELLRTARVGEPKGQSPC